MKTKKLIIIKKLDKKPRVSVYELYLPNVIEYTPEVKISKHKHHSIYIYTLTQTGNHIHYKCMYADII